MGLTKWLQRLPVWLACGALFFLMVLTFSDVILRSAFDAPIQAATELTRILVAVMVFAVMPQISATGGHIAVDLLDGPFARWGLARLRHGLIQLGCAVLLFWPVKQIWVLAERTRGYGDVTEYLGLPQFYIMWFIGIGTAATAIAMGISGLMSLLGHREVQT